MSMPCRGLRRLPFSAVAFVLFATIGPDDSWPGEGDQASGTLIHNDMSVSLKHAYAFLYTSTVVRDGSQQDSFQLFFTDRPLPGGMPRDIVGVRDRVDQVSRESQLVAFTLTWSSGGPHAGHAVINPKYEQHVSLGRPIEVDGIRRLETGALSGRVQFSSPPAKKTAISPGNHYEVDVTFTATIKDLRDPALRSP